MLPSSRRPDEADDRAVRARRGLKRESGCGHQVSWVNVSALKSRDADRLQSMLLSMEELTDLLRRPEGKTLEFKRT